MVFAQDKIFWACISIDVGGFVFGVEAVGNKNAKQITAENR
jgi:hypothetical protein